MSKVSHSSHTASQSHPQNQGVLSLVRQVVVSLVITCTTCLCGARPATGQQYLLQDEFNAPTFDGDKWDVHTGSWFIHRARFGSTPQMVTQGSTSFARLTLDTWNPDFPGSFMRGTEFWSRQQIPLGAGVEFETRMRATNLPLGLIMAFYTYKNKPFNDPSQQEIDIEMIGNQPSNRLWLNVWTSDETNSETNPVIEGLDRRQWVTYKTRWYADKVEWYVNDVLVRTETDVVPTQAMSVCYNVWAASDDWPMPYEPDLEIADNAGENQSFYLDVDYIRVRSLAPASTPYGAAPVDLPGTVQAENFDRGGEGLAFHDTDSINEGEAYRTDEPVDIEPCTDDGGGYNVGYTAPGEWLRYAVNVTQAGTYDIGVRVASAQGGGNFHIEFDGVDVTGPLTIPDTGDWQTFRTITKIGVTLPAGRQSMRLVMESNGESGAVGNFNYVTVAPSGGDTTPPTVTVTTPANEN